MTTTSRVSPLSPGDATADSALDRRFPALDGIRGFAAGLVLLTHAGFISGRSLHSDLLGALLFRADFGVTVFFLLSGFLLYRPFVLHQLAGRPRPNVKRFLWRRLLRIGPALTIFVVVSLTFLTPFRVRPSDYVQYLLLVETYDHRALDANLTHLWSLTVEVSFYALVPVIAWLLGRKRPNPETVLRRQMVLLAGMLVLPSVWIAWYRTYLPGVQGRLWLPAHTEWFALGMGMAVLSACPPSVRGFARLRATVSAWAHAPLTCWSVAAVLYLISTLPLGYPKGFNEPSGWDFTNCHVLYGLSAAFLLLPLTLGRFEMADKVLGSRFGQYLGNISYAFYLWHVPILRKLQTGMGYTTFDGHFSWLLLATAGATVVVSSLSWYLVERVALRYGSSSWRRPNRISLNTTPPAASTTALRHKS